MNHSLHDFIRKKMFHCHSNFLFTISNVLLRMLKIEELLMSIN